MLSNPLHWGCTAPALTHLPAPDDFLLRPQLLTRLSAILWTDLSPVPLSRSFQQQLQQRACPISRS
jgi:hypothetical protein